MGITSPEGAALGASNDRSTGGFAPSGHCGLGFDAAGAYAPGYNVSPLRGYPKQIVDIGIEWREFATRAFALLLIFGTVNLAISHVCFADEEQDKRIRTLVEKLASTNTEPPKEGGASSLLKVPSGYSTEAQAVVHRTIQNLFMEGSVAFDVLIEHFEDKRYSYSYESPSGIHHCKVGSVCRSIMDRSIRCYVYEIPLISTDQWADGILWKVETLPDWWKRNRDRPLWQIQIEAIDTQIIAMKGLDYKTSQTSHPYAKKPPEERFEYLRKESIEKLIKMRTPIESKKSPHCPKTLDDYYRAMTWLPWPTRSPGGK